MYHIIYLGRAQLKSISPSPGARGGETTNENLEETRKQGNTNLATALYGNTNFEAALYGNARKRKVTYLKTHRYIFKNRLWHSTIAAGMKKLWLEDPVERFVTQNCSPQARFFL